MYLHIFQAIEEEEKVLIEDKELKQSLFVPGAELYRTLLQTSASKSAQPLNRYRFMCGMDGDSLRKQIENRKKFMASEEEKEKNREKERKQRDEERKKRQLKMEEERAKSGGDKSRSPRSATSRDRERRDRERSGGHSGHSRDR